MRLPISAYSRGLRGNATLLCAWHDFSRRMWNGLHPQAHSNGDELLGRGGNMSSGSMLAAIGTFSYSKAGRKLLRRTRNSCDRIIDGALTELANQAEELIKRGE